MPCTLNKPSTIFSNGEIKLQNRRNAELHSENSEQNSEVQKLRDAEHFMRDFLAQNADSCGLRRTGFPNLQHLRCCLFIGLLMMPWLVYQPQPQENLVALQHQEPTSAKPMIKHIQETQSMSGNCPYNHATSSWPNAQLSPCAPILGRVSVKGVALFLDKRTN